MRTQRTGSIVPGSRRDARPRCTVCGKPRGTRWRYTQTVHPECERPPERNGRGTVVDYKAMPNRGHADQEELFREIRRVNREVERGTLEMKLPNGDTLTI